MNHSAPRGTLSDYLDAELPDSLASEWRLHLDGCELCRVELSELSAVRTAARTWTPQYSGASQWGSIVARIGNRASQRRPAMRRVVAATIAGLLLAASLTFMVLRARATARQWPGEVISAARAVAVLENTTRPMLDDLSPELRTRLRALLADIDRSLDEIEASRATQADFDLVTDARLGALANKQVLLEGIRDLHTRAAPPTGRPGG